MQPWQKVYFQQHLSLHVTWSEESTPPLLHSAPTFLGFLLQPQGVGVALLDLVHRFLEFCKREGKVTQRFVGLAKVGLHQGSPNCGPRAKSGRRSNFILGCKHCANHETMIYLPKNIRFRWMDVTCPETITLRKMSSRHPWFRVPWFRLNKTVSVRAFAKATVSDRCDKISSLTSSHCEKHPLRWHWPSASKLSNAIPASAGRKTKRFRAKVYTAGLWMPAGRNAVVLLQSRKNEVLSKDLSAERCEVQSRFNAFAWFGLLGSNLK